MAGRNWGASEYFTVLVCWTPILEQITRVLKNWTSVYGESLSLKRKEIFMTCASSCVIAINL
jgi:hypothetical protein